MKDPTKNFNPIDAFRYYAWLASYHYADDTTMEWDSARQAKAIALAVFDYHVGYQKRMRQIAGEQLWADEFKRARPE